MRLISEEEFVDLLNEEIKDAKDIFNADHSFHLQNVIENTTTIDPESLPVVKELREKLARYEQLEAEGRLKILPKSKKGTCGSCQHFHRISGTQRGMCGIKEQRVDRWGNPHERWGRFEPNQGKPSCKQYKDSIDLEE